MGETIYDSYGQSTLVISYTKQLSWDGIWYGSSKVDLLQIEANYSG